VRAGRDRPRGAVAEEQGRECLAVERDDNLPDAHVGGIAAFDGQCRTVDTLFVPHKR
jgi:hypothetical protein